MEALINDPHPALDRDAIIAGLMAPLLLWTGSVMFVTLMGYPGVVCMTPAAWLFAMLVGARIRRDSTTPGTGPIREAAIAGAILGFWEGALFAAAMAASKYIPSATLNDPPNPYLVGTVAILLSMPVTTGISVLVAWKTRPAE